MGEEKTEEGEKNERQSRLTFGYRLTGMSTRSLSLMLLLLKRSKYVSVSFLVSPFWILSISGKGERRRFREKKAFMQINRSQSDTERKIYLQQRCSLRHFYIHS